MQDVKKDNLIELIDNKTIYTFRISDMVNIIENSLCSCEYGMIHNPVPPKNPFTNTPFSKTFFTNLYFKVKHSNLKIPILFHNFFLCYFDLKTFEVEHDVLIREQVIVRYVKNLTIDEYYDNIMRMLRIAKRQYKSNIILNIDQDFPKDIVVDALKNYYHCFLYSEHSINRFKNGIFTRKFKKSISAFHRYNKIFGRLIYSPNNNSKPNFISHYLEYKNVNKFFREQEASDCYEPDTVMDNQTIDNELNFMNDPIYPRLPIMPRPHNIINESANNETPNIETVNNETANNETTNNETANNETTNNETTNNETANITNDELINIWYHNTLHSSDEEKDNNNDDELPLYPTSSDEEKDNNDDDDDIPLYHTSSDEENDDDDMDVH